jgi:hypothetical protein
MSQLLCELRETWRAFVGELADISAPSLVTA